MRVDAFESPSGPARGRAAWAAIVDGVDQHAHAQHVGGEDEFLPLLRAQLAGAGEPIDRGRPIPTASARSRAREAMHVLDQ